MSKRRLSALLCGLAPLLLLATASAQTSGVPFLNRSFVVNPAGVASPPPMVPSCPPPILLAAGAPVSFQVQTVAAGMPVMMIFDVGPCAPGFMCLAPVPAPIPPCLPPCGGTNQSLDLLPAFVLTVTGVTMPLGAGGSFAVPVVTPLPAAGVPLSVQTVILDPAMGPAGFVVTNAYTVSL